MLKTSQIRSKIWFKILPILILFSTVGAYAQDPGDLESNKPTSIDENVVLPLFLFQRVIDTEDAKLIDQITKQNTQIKILYGFLESDVSMYMSSYSIAKSTNKTQDWEKLKEIEIRYKKKLDEFIPKLNALYLDVNRLFTKHGYTVETSGTESLQYLKIFYPKNSPILSQIKEYEYSSHFLYYPQFTQSAAFHSLLQSVALSPRDFEYLLSDIVSPAYFHELGHGQTYFKSMDPLDESIYDQKFIFTFTKLKHGYRSLSADELKMYSDTLFRNSQYLPQLLENNKKLRVLLLSMVDNAWHLANFSMEFQDRILVFKKSMDSASQWKTILGAIIADNKDIITGKKMEALKASKPGVTTNGLIESLQRTLDNRIVEINLEKTFGANYKTKIKSPEIYELIEKYIASPSDDLKEKISIALKKKLLEKLNTLNEKSSEAWIESQKILTLFDVSHTQVYREFEKNVTVEKFLKNNIEKLYEPIEILFQSTREKNDRNEGLKSAVELISETKSKLIANTDMQSTTEDNKGITDVNAMLEISSDNTANKPIVESDSQLPKDFGKNIADAIQNADWDAFEKVWNSTDSDHKFNPYLTDKSEDDRTGKRLWELAGDKMVSILLDNSTKYPISELMGPLQIQLGPVMQTEKNAIKNGDAAPEQIKAYDAISKMIVSMMPTNVARLLLNLKLSMVYPEGVFVEEAAHGEIDSVRKMEKFMDSEQIGRALAMPGTAEHPDIMEILSERPNIPEKYLKLAADNLKIEPKNKSSEQLYADIKSKIISTPAGSNLHALDRSTSEDAQQNSNNPQNSSNNSEYSEQIKELVGQPYYKSLIRDLEMDSSQENRLLSYLDRNQDLAENVSTKLAPMEFGSMGRKPVYEAYFTILESLYASSFDEKFADVKTKFYEMGPKFASKQTTHGMALFEIFERMDSKNFKEDVKTFLKEKLNLENLQTVNPKDYRYTPVAEKFVYQNMVGDIIFGEKNMLNFMMSQNEVYLVTPENLPQITLSNQYNTPAIAHPEFKDYISQLNTNNIPVLIDNFLYYSGSAHYDDKHFFVVSPQSPFHVFAHEFRHFEYETALEVARKELLQDNYTAFWWFVREDGIHKVTKAHKSSDPALLEAFKEKYPVYYSILERAQQLYSEGITNEEAINEALACERQIQEMKKSGLTEDHQDVVRTERYKLSFQLGFLRDKEHENELTDQQKTLLAKIENEDAILKEKEAKLPRPTLNNLPENQRTQVAENDIEPPHTPDTKGKPGFLSFLGLGEFSDRLSSDKPGVLNQAYEWARNKWNGTSAVESTNGKVVEMNSSKAAAQSVAATGTDGKVVSGSTTNLQAIPGGKSQTTATQAKVIPINTSSQSASEQFHTMLNELMNKSSNSEREDYFAANRTKFIQLQEIMSREQSSRANAVRWIAGMKLAERASVELQHAAVNEFPKFFAAGMISHMIIAARDPNVSVESFSEMIRGIPMEFIRNFTFAMGSTAGTTLFDIVTPMMGDKLMQAYENEGINRVMAETKKLNLNQALANKATAREFLRGQLGMFAGTLVNLALFEKNLSMDQMFRSAIKTQLSFIIANGQMLLIKGYAMATLGDVMESVMISTRANAILGTVIFAIELVFADDHIRWINFVEQNAILQNHLASSLQAWKTNATDENFGKVVANMDGYWTNIVAKDVQAAIQKHYEEQDDVDDKYEFAVNRDGSKGYPLVPKNDGVYGLQNDRIFSEYREEASAKEKAIVDTIEPSKRKIVKLIRESEQRNAAFAKSCTFEVCQKSILEKRDELNGLKRGLWQEMKSKIFTNTADFSGISFLSSLIPSVLNAKEWVRVGLSLAEASKEGQREQILQLLMRKIERSEHVYKQQRKDFTLTETTVDNSFHKNVIRPYDKQEGYDKFELATRNDTLDKVGAFMLVVPANKSENDVQAQVFESLMEVAYVQCTDKLEGAKLAAKYVKAKKSTNAKTYAEKYKQYQLARAKLVEGMKTANEKWFYIKDHPDKNITTTDDRIAVIEVTQAKEETRNQTTPYVDFLYTVPVQQKVLSQYQKYMGCNP